jgi:hypothetical protein
MSSDTVAITCAIAANGTGTGKCADAALTAKDSGNMRCLALMANGRNALPAKALVSVFGTTLKSMHADPKAPIEDAAPSALHETTCCAFAGDNSACGANPPKSERRIIADAQRERLNHGLRTLASWCASRAMLEHDTETTLTMLEKKAAELRGKVMKAGWAAIAEHSLHNA